MLVDVGGEPPECWKMTAMTGDSGMPTVLITLLKSDDTAATSPIMPMVVSCHDMAVHASVIP